MPETACPTGGCAFRTESQAEMDMHQQGHKIDGIIGAVDELRGEIQAQPGAVARHFQATIDNMDPKHMHLHDVISHAESGDCPACVSFKSDYDAKLLETFTTDQADAAATAAAEAEAAAVAATPAAEEPAEEPAAEEPAPVVARVFDMDDIDHFKVGAYGMETVLDDVTGKYTIKVKPGDDNAELANEAIADGRVLPANCVLRVGDGGKTTYVCDPEPEPAPAG